MDLAEPGHKWKTLKEILDLGFQCISLASTILMIILKQESKVAVVTERVDDGHAHVNGCLTFLSVLVAFFIGGR